LAKVISGLFLIAILVIMLNRWLKSNESFRSLKVLFNQSGWVCDLAEDSAFPMAKTEKPSLPSPPTVATVLAMKAGRVVVVIVFAVFLLAID